MRGSPGSSRMSAVRFGLMVTFLVGASLVLLFGCKEEVNDDPVVARVGNSVMTRSNLISLYGLNQEQFTSEGKTKPEWLEDAARKWALEEILVQEATKRALDRDSTFTNRMESLRREILIAMLCDQSAASIVVDSSDVQQEYEQHLQEYASRYDAVDLVYVHSPTRELASRARLEMKSGRSLSDVLALDDSLSGEALGWVGEKDLNPTIANLVFALLPGGTSNPIKLEDGEYVIFQCLQRRQAGTILPLEEVEQDIRGRILLRKKLDAEQSLKNGLWMAYNPQVYLNSSE